MKIKGEKIGVKYFSDERDIFTSDGFCQYNKETVTSWPPIFYKDRKSVV